MNIERIQCGNGNCYLLHENGNAVLVDTARAQYHNVILEKCLNSNVRLIVLTHGHVDHVQNAAALSQELGAPIAMSKADIHLLDNNLAEKMYAHRLLGKIILALSEKGFREDVIEPFKVDIELKEGDSLDAYGVSAKIISLPGHTKGSLGILAGTSDVLVGDALMNFIRPQKSLLYGNWPDVEKSAAVISGLGDVTVHFGHGSSSPNRKW
jgi:glyoxylase-like metal-dependent hydrolase (beta-lactamase superfamily II)